MRFILSKIIKLFLIRHARQESPLCNVNVPLADEGLIQSKLLGERLKNYNIDKIYSSDLIRAKSTAGIVSEIIFGENLNCELEELSEMDFGDMTGLSDEVIKVKFADYFIKRDLMDEDIAIPGGENGKMVYERVRKAVDRIIEDAMRDNCRNIVIVSHGGAIRSFLAGVLGMPQEKRFMFAKNMENTSITQIDYNIDTQKFYVEVINDYAHLEEHDKLLRKHFK